MKYLWLYHKSNLYTRNEKIYNIMYEREGWRGFYFNNVNDKYFCNAYSSQSCGDGVSSATHSFDNLKMSLIGDTPYVNV